MQTRHILGLDIGANSIGWAAVECRSDTLSPVRLLDLNSHIFQEAVDNKEIPFNARRREKRLMRRQLSRRASRRRGLVEILRENGFLPKNWDAAAGNAVDYSFAERLLRDPSAKQFIGGGDEKTLASPFAIRAYALDAKLEKHEFGRAILHLHRRRGFRSNRGAKYLNLLGALGKSDFAETDADKESGGDQKKKEETGQILLGISLLEKQMKKRDSRTVGEHVWKIALESNTAPARITTSSVHFVESERRARGKMPARLEKVALYAKREMTENEFQAICKIQKLDDAVQEEIRKALFEQLPVGIPPPSRRLPHLRYNAVGRCSLEPGKRRADKAAPVSQEFRTWAVINNIAAMDGEIPSPERRQELFDACQDPEKLNRQGRLSWTQAAKILGVGKLNYDRDNPDMKSGLIGNRVIRDLFDAMGAENWTRFADDPDKLNFLTEDLLTIADKLALYNRLVRRWKFAAGLEGAAFMLATLELEGGHMKYSRRAMARMLPHMRPDAKSGNSGMNEHDSMKAAGYEEVKSPFKPGDPDKELLPLAAVPETANPRVQRAMFAVRRIVNAAARRWGRPAAIRVEMPRDMKASKKHRSEIETQQAANRKRNAEAESELIKHAAAANNYRLSPLKRSPISGKTAYRVSRADRDKFKMWKFEQDCKCPYCGGCIGIDELLSEAFEVDHILPQSAFQQSYMNTVVACQNCNREKSGRTPWDAWGGSDKWDSIAHRADLDGKKAAMPRLPREKRRRILNKKTDFLSEEEFCNRALQDTQYVAALTHGFLSATGIPVQVGRGQATAILRREWGLNDVLPRHPDDEFKPADFADGVLRPERTEKTAKNRRDHRHHAVDAFIVAMTGPGTLQRLIGHCQERQKLGPKKRPDPFDLPKNWQGNIYGQVRDRLNAKVVSHQKSRKVRGALHEETIYGRGFYTETISWPRDKNALREIRKYNLPGPRPVAGGDAANDGDFFWIPDADIHAAFAEWVKNPNNPPPSGLTEIPVARRFYFVRRNVADALKYAGGEWRRGNKQWIVDKGVHETLSQWMADNGLKPDDAKAIARALESNPPQTFAREGRRANPIRSVRMGMIMKRGVKTLPRKAEKNRATKPPRSVKLGSNHHLEIFYSGEQRKTRIVSMLEAAERKLRKESIVNQTPDPEWGEGWQFQCSLAQGDLVVFNREKVGERIRGILEEHDAVFRSIAYRVQSVSMTETGPDIFFRHHAVSGTDGKDKHGFIRVKSVADLDLWKKEVGVLGADFSALER